MFLFPNLIQYPPGRDIEFNSNPLEFAVAALDAKGKRRRVRALPTTRFFVREKKVMIKTL